MEQDKLIRIGLALMLFLCLLPMPYGYYQLVRIVSMGAFILMAYRTYEKPDKTEMIIYIVLAFLFQPFWKVTLGRMIWNIVDVIVGIGLLASAFRTTKE